MKPTTEKATREYIESLQVGDLAPDCFGKLSEITEIYGLGVNSRGGKYICYYTKLSDNATISRSLIEGQPYHYQL